MEVGKRAVAQVRAQRRMWRGACKALSAAAAPPQLGVDGSKTRELGRYFALDEARAALAAARRCHARTSLTCLAPSHPARPAHSRRT